MKELEATAWYEEDEKADKRFDKYSNGKWYRPTGRIHVEWDWHYECGEYRWSCWTALEYECLDDD